MTAARRHPSLDNPVAGVPVSGPARRNVHVAFPRGPYVKLKIATFERQLSINEAIAGFAALVATNDSSAYAVLNRLAQLKYDGRLDDKMRGALSDADRDMLYDLMEEAAGGREEAD